MANTTGKKYGGRTKGAVNHSTAEIRQHYQNLVSDNLEQLKDDLKKLEPLQRLKIIIELSKFIVPTLKAIDVTNDAVNTFKPITVNIVQDDDIKKIINDLEAKY